MIKAESIIGGTLLFIVGIGLFYTAIFLPSLIALGAIITAPIGMFIYPFSLIYKKIYKDKDISIIEFSISIILSLGVAYIAYNLYMSGYLN